MWVGHRGTANTEWHPSFHLSFALRCINETSYFVSLNLSCLFLKIPLRPSSDMLSDTALEAMSSEHPQCSGGVAMMRMLLVTQAWGIRKRK